MPSLETYPINEPKALESLAQDEESDRSTAIGDAWKYYNGQMDKPLKVRTGAPDDNVLLRLTTKMVDQAVSLLFGALPDIEQTNEGDDLAMLWEANRMPILLHDTALYGAIAGHCFWKILPDEEIPARVINLDPALVTCFWHPDDKQRVSVYKVEWTQGPAHMADRYRQDIIAGWALPEDAEVTPRPGEDEWLIRDLFAPKGTRWEVMGENVWGYEFAPILDWQNLPQPKAFYGSNDLVNVGLNDQCNFIASNINRILKFHAHPRTLVLGAQADGVHDTAVDNMWVIPTKDARVENLEMQSDLASSLEFLTRLQAAFYSEHRAVDMGTLRDKLGQITNFGLRTLFKDALDKLGTKRELYGAALEEASRRLMVLAYGREVEIDIHWPDPLPLNGLEEVQEIQLEMGLGILSKETASAMRGRAWETEQDRITNEQASQENVGSILLRAFEQGNV